MEKRRIDYAVVLLERLRTSPGDFLDIGSVAREFRFPGAFLEKVAQDMKRAGWIESQKGRGGGYRLTDAGKNINIADAINFFERPFEVCPVLRTKNNG